MRRIDLSSLPAWRKVVLFVGFCATFLMGLGVFTKEGYLYASALTTPNFATRETHPVYASQVSQIFDSGGGGKSGLLESVYGRAPVAGSISAGNFQGFLDRGSVSRTECLVKSFCASTGLSNNYLKGFSTAIPKYFWPAFKSSDQIRWHRPRSAAATIIPS